MDVSLGAIFLWFRKVLGFQYLESDQAFMSIHDVTRLQQSNPCLKPFLPAKGTEKGHQIYVTSLHES